MSESFKTRGGGWVLGQFTLMLAVVALGVVFRGHWASLASRAAGALLVVLGGWFGIAGVRALGENRTPFPKPRAGSTLVRTGIYRVVRHPLYASVILLGLAWGFLWCSGPALAASVVLGFFLDAKSRREERWLRANFEDYAAYSKSVRRLVPGFY